MSKERVYILHKNGANSHYTGLKHLLSQEGVELSYVEFSIFSKLFKSLRKLRFQLFVKQLKNIFFFLSLLISRDKKIILGIAPFDSKLIKLLPFLKKHRVYYHSSWTYWDKTFHPKKKKNSPKVFNKWAYFLEEKVAHHFVVTQQTKDQLIANYKIDSSKISVVAHSLKPAFMNANLDLLRSKNSFIYIGRLVPQKGIEEVLDFFAKHKECTLTLIGNGKLKKSVETAAANSSNITYKSYISNANDLTKEIQSNQFMVLNSKTTEKWEELFGLAIIESMSQGTIPVSSSHSGPKEIITEETGYLFDEGNLEKCLLDIISSEGFSKKMSDQCIVESQKYSPENIALRWKQILD